uniref:Uncharacterized protein n=1 Tax=Ananas comosus var. bracteatus TaxID=296719 RepID=A0A6V7QTT0_ANACO
MESTSSSIFKFGRHGVKLFGVESNAAASSADSYTPPPKPLLIASPCEEGDYAVVLFLHGYLLYNSFYSQLFQHVASHGFVVIGPQLYSISGPDATEEIKSAGDVTDWLIDGLSHVLPTQVRPILSKLSIAGHSRGGKVAFGLALGYTESRLKFSALMGIDPVDGMDKGKQTPPPILTHVPHSFDLKVPVMVVGSGLGEIRRNPLFPPCAPKGVSHKEFFDECGSPSCYFVAKEYGHADMLDDETKGLGEWPRDNKFLMAIRDDPEIAPVELSTIAFL